VEDEAVVVDLVPLVAVVAAAGADAVVCVPDNLVFLVELVPLVVLVAGAEAVLVPVPTPPWCEQAPFPVLVLVVPSLQVTVPVVEPLLVVEADVVLEAVVADPVEADPGLATPP
jgi:hypothetical protein